MLNNHPIVKCFRIEITKLLIWLENTQLITLAKLKLLNMIVFHQSAHIWKRRSNFTMDTYKTKCVRLLGEVKCGICVKEFLFSFLKIENTVWKRTHEIQSESEKPKVTYSCSIQGGKSLGTFDNCLLLQSMNGPKVLQLSNENGFSEITGILSEMKT